jgi:hypothetical protein
MPGSPGGRWLRKRLDPDIMMTKDKWWIKDK